MLLASRPVLGAVFLGQTDDFENLTTQAWSEGVLSPNPPQNVPDGGPNGAGDAFLRLSSSGGSGPGGKMVSFNRSQWTGDYLGITAISLSLNNEGTSSLSMRVGFEGANGSRFVSSSGILLSPGSGWGQFLFPVTDAGLTRVSGTGSFAQTLGNVVELRLLSSTTVQWQGDSIAGTLGVDNIVAVPEPAAYPWLLGSAAAVIALFHRRRMAGASSV